MNKQELIEALNQADIMLRPAAIVVNAVKLTTGETALFYENTEVVKTSAKIVEG